MAKDLRQTAQYFEASTKLEWASSKLKALAAGDTLNEDEREALQWAGTYLSRVSKEPGQTAISGGLVVQATSARPTFYSVLRKIAGHFKERGLTTPEASHEFLKAMLSVLSTGENQQARLDTKQLELAAILLHELSLGLLRQTGWSSHRNAKSFPRTSIAY